MVSKVYPKSHYTLFLGRALEQISSGRIRPMFYRSRSEGIPPDLEGIKDVWSQNILYPFQIFRQVVRDRPSVVHVQHEFGMFGGPMTALMFPTLLALLKIAGTRTIVTIHAIVPPRMIDSEFAKTFSMPARSWPLLRLALISIYQVTVALPTALIVHARSHKSLLQLSYSARPTKISVIPIGVPEQLRETPNSHKWKNMLHGRKVILFFGYLTGRKGVDYLLRAFSQLAHLYPNWVLVVAGGKLGYSAPYIESLRRLITDLRIGGSVIMITTTPFPLEELDELFDLSEFVVLPYLLPVGGGSLVLSYAMQHAKPVIVSDSDVMRELVCDGEEGLLCKSGDVDSLRAAMKMLMENPSLRENFSIAMRAKAGRLSWTHVAEATCDLYVRLSVP